MAFTMVCWVGLAMESRALPAALNHELCQLRGGVLMRESIKGFGKAQVGALCECECHERQNRRWHARERKLRPWEHTLVEVI